MRQKRETQKGFQIQGPSGSIRGAKTYSPNQIRYSENTESYTDLKPLTQYEEITSSESASAGYYFPRLPCRCTADDLHVHSFHIRRSISQSTFFLCPFCDALLQLVPERKEHHILHEFLQTKTKDVIRKGGDMQ